MRGRGSGGGDGGKGVSTPCFLSFFSKARLRVMPNGVKVLSVFGFPSDKILTSLFLLVPPRSSISKRIISVVVLLPSGVSP